MEVSFINKKSSVADPGCLSRIRIFSIPDPGVNTAPDPASGSATLQKRCVALHLLLQALGKKGPGVKKVKTFCCMNSARQRHESGPRLVLIHAILLIIDFTDENCDAYLLLLDKSELDMAGRGHVGVDPETRMDHEHTVICNVGTVLSRN